jgi:hypothetical protein
MIPAVDPAKARLVGEFKHDRPLLGCRIDPSGRFVFAGAQGNSVVRWTLADGHKTLFEGHRSWVRGLTFCAAEKLVFTAGYEGKVLAWPVDADKPAPARTLDAHQGWVRSLAVSPDGKTLASCGNDHFVRLWSTADGRLLRELSGHECHVYDIAFHPRGRYLVSGDLKGVVKVWNLERGTVERQLDASALYKYDPVFMADHGGVRGMTFRVPADPKAKDEGTTLACCGITEVSNAFAGIGKPLVLLFDWPPGDALPADKTPGRKLQPKQNFQGTAWGVAFHPAGFIAAVGGGNGGLVWFWKLDATQDFATLKLPANGRDLDLHPDGHRLAVACADGVLRLYDLAPPK